MRAFVVGEVAFPRALCFQTAEGDPTGPRNRFGRGPPRATPTVSVSSTCPLLISGRWRDCLPGDEPGGLAVSACNPIVARRDVLGA